jgi:hypothetical protein
MLPSGVDNQLGKSQWFDNQDFLIIISKLAPRSRNRDPEYWHVWRTASSPKEPTTRFSICSLWDLHTVEFVGAMSVPLVSAPAQFHTILHCCYVYMDVCVCVYACMCVCVCIAVTTVDVSKVYGILVCWWMGLYAHSSCNSYNIISSMVILYVIVFLYEDHLTFPFVGPFCVPVLKLCNTTNP